MTEPNMFQVRGNGVDIQLAEWPGDGAPILCIHGLTANCRSFDAVASGISPPHRLLAVDLRGRGLSDKPDSGYSWQHHCRDLAEVAANTGLKNFYLLGHSLGAYIALAYAAQHPDQVEGLVLVDGGANLTPEQWAKVTAGIKPSLDRLGKTFPSFEAYIELAKQAPFMQPWNEAAENYFRYESEQTPDGGRRSRIDPAHIEEERGNLLSLNPEEFYPSINCPVLILRATEPMVTGDDFVLPEAALPGFQAALPRARLVNLSGINHYSIVMQPCPRRDRAILDFLAA
jgi:pimeloyl-ACP methyl ester carboxylesterase